MKSQILPSIIIMVISALLCLVGGPARTVGYILGGLTTFYIIVLVLGAVIRRRQDSAMKTQSHGDGEGSEILFI